MNISEAGINNKIGSIYKLVDPVSGEVRYIGQTTVSLKERLKKHICDSRSPSVHVRCWIKGLIDKGERPIIELIKEVSIDDLDDEEIGVISEYKKSGANLTNISLGGQTKRGFAEETKMKIANSLKGHVQSEATKLKRRETLNEVWKDPALRELKRKQTIELNKLGLIGTKGKRLKPRGPMSNERKSVVSVGLKKYFEKNEVWSKITGEKATDIINDYQFSELTLNELSKKYDVGRVTITAIAKRAGINFRNDGRKKIDETVLRRLVEEDHMTQKDIAIKLGCSISNVEKFKKIYRIYRGRN